MVRDTFKEMIRAFKHRTPFKPFTVATVSGNRYEVDYPDALAVRERLDADRIEAKGLLTVRVSPVKITLLVGAFLFSVMPVAGPVFLLLAWLPNGSPRLWFRVACRLCLLLHVAAMNVLVVSAMIFLKQ